MVQISIPTKFSFLLDKSLQEFQKKKFFLAHRVVALPLQKKMYTFAQICTLFLVWMMQIESSR